MPPTRSASEGQMWWAGDPTDWLADAVTTDFLDRQPDHHQARDFVAELDTARRVFGGCTDADFENVDPFEHPWILGRSPVTLGASSPDPRYRR